MHTWTLEYKNENKEIEKRLLCQPKTYKFNSGTNQLEVTFDKETGLSRLVEVISEFVMERVFRELALSHMREQGYNETFIQGYLSRDLYHHINRMPWIETCKRDIENEAGELHEQDSIDLESFILFHTHKLRENIAAFLRLCDGEIKEQLVEMTLKPLFETPEEEWTEEDKEEELIIDVIEEEGDVLLAVNGEVRWSGDDVKNHFDGIFSQAAYTEDGIMFQEYSSIVLLIIFAKLFRVSTYVTENAALCSWLALLFERYQMKTRVELYNQQKK